MVVMSRTKPAKPEIPRRLYAVRCPRGEVGPTAKDMYYLAGPSEQLLLELLMGNITWGTALEAARFRDSGRQ